MSCSQTLFPLPCPNIDIYKQTTRNFIPFFYNHPLVSLILRAWLLTLNIWHTFMIADPLLCSRLYSPNYLGDLHSTLVSHLPGSWILTPELLEYTCCTDVSILFCFVSNSCILVMWCIVEILDYTPSVFLSAVSLKWHPKKTPEPRGFVNLVGTTSHIL